MLSREADLSENLNRLSLDRVPLPWSSLPPEVVDLILAFLPLREVYKARVVCKSFSGVIKRGTFRQARLRIRPTEYTLSPLIFYVKGDSWRVTGFEYKSQVWRTLPPIQHSIPAPDPDLVLKDLFVSADKGLFCVNVGKASEAEKLIVYNPLTGETFKLPPLEFSRHPVVIDAHVTLAKADTESIVTLSFLVIVVGSAAIGTEGLSRKTDVYDSVKGRWEAAGDVPGADFSLNEYQTGVYCERMNLLLCVGFMVNGSKGILAFDVESRKWREDWICPFYQLQDQVNDTALVVHDQATDTTSMVQFTIAQLVQCSGSIYLFAEQEAGRDVTHCIDRLDLDSEGEGFTWTRVVTQQRQRNRALLVYPEYTCVPVAVDKVSIFNTVEKTGVVYDLRNEAVVPEPVETVPAPEVNGIMFHSLNPVGYAFEPTFGVPLPEEPKEDGDQP